MLEVLSLFIFIAGFIIGLGAVTVIDLHGFFARKSSYRTLATIRTHKITKPLIWLGMMMAIVGGTLFYRGQAIEGIVLYHLIVAIVLIVNGSFLSFYISPYLLKKERDGKDQELLPNTLQIAIIISFLISFFCWRSALFFLVVKILGFPL